ncbi:MAG: site-2 protease family protein [Candidatus Eremiobacteraeota bacterium]|nr:site-2 protease family protein [Candidatus Eremiobacteraeota bacterium]
MFPSGKGLKIMTINGIPIRIDWSWLIVFFLVTWTLAENYYFQTFKTDPRWLNWSIGALSALLLFTSILLHEISHSLVAQATGLPIKGITLFIFGGVAQMTEEPKSPEQEFMIAIAGPIMSFALAVLFFSLYFLLRRSIGFAPLTAMFSYLGIINIVLIVFNMVPGMPLDGGRILRAILWKLLDNLAKATKITSILGKGFGYLLVLFGAIQVFSGNLVGGVWLSIIGLFLTRAARMSYENVFIADILEGVSVRDAMAPNPVTVPSDITLENLASDYFLRHPFGGYPVKRSRHILHDGFPVHESSFSVSYNSNTNDETDYVDDSPAFPEIHTESIEIDDSPAFPEIHTESIEHETTPEEEAQVLHKNESTEAVQPLHSDEFTLEEENVPDDILGYVGINDLNSIDRSLWSRMTVEELLQKRQKKCLSVNPETNLKEALGIMEQENVSCLMIMDRGKFLGIVNREDVIGLISVRSKIVGGLRK